MGCAGTSNRWRDSPFPLDLTGNLVLWDLDAKSVNALFGAALSAHQVRHAGPDAFCAQRLHATSDRSR